jgi:hypothetical protein
MFTEDETSARWRIAPGFEFAFCHSSLVNPRYTLQAFRKLPAVTLSPLKAITPTNAQRYFVMNPAKACNLNDLTCEEQWMRYLGCRSAQHSREANAQFTHIKWSTSNP